MFSVLIRTDDPMRTNHHNFVPLRKVLSLRTCITLHKDTKKDPKKELNNFRFT